MNIFQWVICTQYRGLSRQDKDVSETRFRSIVVMSAVMFFHLFLLIELMVLAGWSYSSGIHAGGRLIGKLAAVLVIGFFYLLIRATIGKQPYIDKTIAAYHQLEEEEQRWVAIKGEVYMVVAMLLPVIIFFMMIID